MMRHRFTVTAAMIAATIAIQADVADAQYAREHYSRRHSPTVYAFGARSHLDELAVQLKNQANDVCWEMYRHYQHNHDFRETYREMYQVLQDAKHIHDLAHEDAHHNWGGQGHEDHIARDLHDMDRLFHHIEDDVEHWDAGRGGYDPYHHRDHYFRGHYGGDLHAKLHRFETTLHHLMRDYGVRSRVGEYRPAPGPPSAPPGDFAPGPGSGPLTAPGRP